MPRRSGRSARKSSKRIARSQSGMASAQGRSIAGPGTVCSRSPSASIEKVLEPEHAAETRYRDRCSLKSKSPGSNPGSICVGVLKSKRQPGAFAVTFRTKPPSQQGRSWRARLPVHPAAELFPRMSPDELRALGEDIKNNGQRQPIAIIERARRRPDGTLHVKDPPLQEVLDGISRLDAMEMAGIKVIGENGQLDARIQQVEVDADEVDPVAYVISANIHRRHLKPKQKREIIAELIKAQPEKPDLQIAKMIGVSPTTVGTVRREMEAKGDVSKLETR